MADRLRAINEVQQAGIIARRRRGESPKVELSLPHECRVGYFPQDDGSVRLGLAFVPDDLQGNGIGTRLVQSATADAKRQGATVLRGAITSSAGLHLVEKTFGDTARVEDPSGTSTPLSMLRREVRDSADTRSGIRFTVALERVNTDGWELPVETG